MSTHTLLMIEDDVRLADMVSDYLGKTVWPLCIARMQPVGWPICRAAGKLPDLLILDLMLPDMDGLEVCRRLRAMPGPVAKCRCSALTARVTPWTA